MIKEKKNLKSAGGGGMVVVFGICTQKEKEKKIQDIRFLTRYNASQKNSGATYLKY